MNKEKQLIPELRFPEFDHENDWIVKRLGLLTNTTIGEFVIKTKQDPMSPYPVYNGGKSYTGFYDEFNNEANKIVISARGANAGFVNLVKQKYWAGNSCYSVEISDKAQINLELLFYYIKHNQRRFTDNQQAANIPSVSKGDVEKFKICFPDDILEQQKIASCLSSLDAVITAQKEKLELLKNHKKGLMQNLFPQEGETAPKFRFPEFENDGDWEEKKLGDITENVMYGMNASAIRYDGENKYIRITDIDENSRTFLQNSLTSPNGQLEEKYILKIGDLLFARTGASVGKSYLHQKENGKIYFAGFLIRLTIKNEIPYFIYAQTLTDQYFKWVIKTSMRSGQPGLNAEEYKSYRVFIPPSINEQEKIVSGLSSLDELISSEKERLEKLQLHKKGLMQGLFPKMID